MNLRIDDEILVRECVTSDAEIIHNSFATQGYYLRQWLPVAAIFNTVDDVADYIYYASMENVFLFSIEYKQQFAGMISMSAFSSINQSAELGYWLRKEFQGKGIMTRSLQAIIQQAYDKKRINRLVIKCATENFSSQRIPEKLGFTYEGTERDGEKSADGYFVDLKVYSRLKNDKQKL